MRDRGEGHEPKASKARSDNPRTVHFASGSTRSSYPGILYRGWK